MGVVGTLDELGYLAGSDGGPQSASQSDSAEASSDLGSLDLGSAAPDAPGTLAPDFEGDEPTRQGGAALPMGAGSGNPADFSDDHTPVPPPSPPSHDDISVDLSKHLDLGQSETQEALMASRSQGGADAEELGLAPVSRDRSKRTEQAEEEELGLAPVTKAGPGASRPPGGESSGEDDMGLAPVTRGGAAASAPSVSRSWTAQDIEPASPGKPGAKEKQKSATMMGHGLSMPPATPSAATAAGGTGGAPPAKPRPMPPTASPTGASAAPGPASTGEPEAPKLDSLVADAVDKLPPEERPKRASLSGITSDGRPEASPVALPKAPPASVRSTEVVDAPAAGGRSGLLVFMVLLLVLALAAAAWFFLLREPLPEVRPMDERAQLVEPSAQPAVAPTPVGPPRATVVAGPPPVELKTASGGKVEWVVDPGTEVAEGDVVVKLAGAKRQERVLQNGEERLAYYQEKLERAQEAANEAAIASAQRKVDQKQNIVAGAQNKLQELVVKASAAGVVEPAVSEGASVEADQAVARLGQDGLMAVFTEVVNPLEAGSSVQIVGANDPEQQVEGKVIRAQKGEVTVLLPTDAGLAPGAMVTLQL